MNVPPEMPGHTATSSSAPFLCLQGPVKTSGFVRKNKVSAGGSAGHTLLRGEMKVPVHCQMFL